MSRFKKHLFFCVNQRDPSNPKGSCNKGGASSLLNHAKMLSHKMGLKDGIRVNKAGCLNACTYGPTIVIYPEGIWYAPRTKEDIEEILQEHVQNNRVVERLVIHFTKK